MHYNQIILVKLTPNQSRLHFNFNLVVFVAELPAADQPTTKGVVAVVPITVTDRSGSSQRKFSGQNEIKMILVGVDNYGIWRSRGLDDRTWWGSLLGGAE